MNVPFFLRDFLISWLILVLIFVVFGRGALSVKCPARLQALPGGLQAVVALLMLYGWTIPAAFLIALLWYFL